MLPPPPPPANVSRFCEAHAQRVTKQSSGYIAGSRRCARESGFSLVELSIVLVILGLLTGGILTGQNLIRAAELRKVVTQKEQIQTAVMTFRDKYMALPGDMPNATLFWTKAADCYAASTGTQTCNGNGSGRLAYVSTTADSSNVEYEPWHFWKQLSNAQLMPGSYSGFSDNTKCGGANYCMEGGINAPVGPFSGSGWFAFSMATTPKNWQGRAYDQSRNIIVLGMPSNIPGNLWYGPSLSAQEAWNIDTKIDDGKPYSGKMVDMSGVSSFYTPNCATMNSDEFGSTPPGTTTVNADYRFDRTSASTTEGCLPHFDLE